ncbi:hypothetical protein BCR32DRAFT_271517 [Anaeromyces robustus]|uniref:Uncharacterized protein n=1 Tax=Anaeromyces robustus TaxID=1754192 RepID=A0A1Y1WR88_9FUNG|nr:hypothetical protein BCR32DRAFT_271517 [Anaeromyces robustus]|eukprot:ORX76047.1 hypothetical protein BCR32DRAFT_271517 [Anaeromyces robustus]
MESLLDLPVPIIEYIFTWLDHPEHLFLTCKDLYKIFCSNHVQLNWLLNYFSNASNTSISTFEILHKDVKNSTIFRPISPRISASPVNMNEKSNNVSIFPFNILIRNPILTELFINNALHMCIPFIDDYIYEIRRSSSEDELLIANAQQNNTEIISNSNTSNIPHSNIIKKKETQMEYINQAVNSHTKQIQIIQIIWLLSTYLSWKNVLNSIIDYVKYAFPEWINNSIEISLGLYQFLPTEPISILLNNIPSFSNNDYTPILQLLIDKDLLQPNAKNFKLFLSSLKKGTREKEIVLVYNHWFYSEDELNNPEYINNEKYKFTIENVHQILMSATQSGSENLVKMILKSRVTNTSESINIASREGYLSILKLLINYEKVNIQHIKETDNFSDLMKSNSRHPLIVALTRAIENASWRNFPSIVEYLFEQIPDYYFENDSLLYHKAKIPDSMDFFILLLKRRSKYLLENPDRLERYNIPEPSDARINQPQRLLPFQARYINPVDPWARVLINFFAIHPIGTSLNEGIIAEDLKEVLETNNIPIHALLICEQLGFDSHYDQDSLLRYHSKQINAFEENLIEKFPKGSFSNYSNLIAANSSSNKNVQESIAITVHLINQNNVKLLDNKFLYSLAKQTAFKEIETILQKVNFKEDVLNKTLSLCCITEISSKIIIELLNAGATAYAFKDPLYYFSRHGNVNHIIRLLSLIKEYYSNLNLGASSSSVSPLNIDLNKYKEQLDKCFDSIQMLEIASENGHLEVVKLLVEGSPSLEIDPVDVSHENKALPLAISQNKWNIANYLMKNNAYPKALYQEVIKHNKENEISTKEENIPKSETPTTSSISELSKVALPSSLFARDSVVKCRRKDGKSRYRKTGPDLAKAYLDEDIAGIPKRLNETRETINPAKDFYLVPTTFPKN